MQENNKSAETEENLEENPEVHTEEAPETTETENVESASNDQTELLQAEMEQLKKEKEDTYQRMLRTQAEFENFKKRTQKERQAERKYKSQDLVQELLPVLDNFERALKVEPTGETKSVIEGISMVYNQFQDALKAQGVETIEAEGKEFDPNIHHAVMQVEEEGIESNVVVEELQKGYMLNDRVVRPAMVKVNK